MQQTLVTLSFVLTVSLPAVVFFALAGRAILEVAGVNETSLALWLIAPSIGALCWSGFSFFILSVAGFHSPIIWAGAIALVAASLFALRGTWRTRAAMGSALPILVLLAAFAILPIFPLLPTIKDGGLYFGLPIFDHVKTALVDSIYREGLPPISPFIAPDGKPAGLFYYYGWYVLAAELRAIFGCSGYIADVALSHVTAICSLALMSAIAYRLSGSRTAIGGVMLIASAADPQSLLAKLIGWPALLRLTGGEWGIQNWLEQSFWVPQHVFAAIGVVVAMLTLCWLCAANSKIWRLALILGASAAASVTSSIYAGVFVLAALALPAALLIIWKGPSLWRIAPPLLAAIALASLLTVPMILNLAFLGSGPEKIVAFWIYPSLGFVGQATIGGQIAHIISFWVLLLPLQLGLAYVLGLWQLRRLPAAPHTEQFLFWALTIVVVFLSLVIAQFVKSTISRNDLGWRIILPAVLLLTANAGAKVGYWLDCLMITDDGALRRSRSWVAAAVLIVAAITVPLTLLGVRQASEQYFGENDIDQASPQVHRVLAAQPAAWRDVQARTNPSDLVVSNPTAFDDSPDWGANLPWALFANRSSLLSSANWAGLLSSQLRSSGIIQDYAQMLVRLFAARAEPQDLDALAGRLNVRMIMVTPLDGLWADDSTLTGRYERVAEAEAYRLYAHLDHR